MSLAKASSFWREQESSGILRIPEESRVNTGIPVPQEFPRKIPVKAKKQEFLRPPPKPRSCEKFLLKTQVKKKILRNPVRNGFLGPKNKFLKTGITNLGGPPTNLGYGYGYCYGYGYGYCYGYGYGYGYGYCYCYCYGYGYGYG